MLTLPAELDRLLPTDAEKTAIGLLEPSAADLAALADDKADIDALVAEKTDLLSLAGTLLTAIQNLYDHTEGEGLSLFDSNHNMRVPGGVIAGRATWGAVTLCAGQFVFTTNDATRATYVHILTPLIKTTNCIFRFQAEGYGLYLGAGNTGSLLNLQWSGYITGSAVSATFAHYYDPHGLLNPTAYIGSNDYLYLRLGPTNPYYLTLAVHSLYQRAGACLSPGDLTASLSTSATL